MEGNFHAFVFIMTIAAYVYFKNSKKDQDKQQPKKSNLIYVLSVPIILYTGFYFYKSKQQPAIISNNSSQPQSYIDNEDLLSIPYPMSSESSF
jgi:hypothetical protein